MNPADNWFFQMKMEARMATRTPDNWRPAGASAHTGWIPILAYVTALLRRVAYNGPKERPASAAELEGVRGINEMLAGSDAAERRAAVRDWVNCPICDEPDMRCETFDEGATLIRCTNHACPSNKKTIVPPKPAPDAMREALKLIERTCHTRAATVAREALRSAPVPSPDGAGESLLTFTATVDTQSVVHSRIETHESSFVEAYNSLLKVQEELEEQISKRRDCPAYRKSKECPGCFRISIGCSSPDCPMVRENANSLSPPATEAAEPDATVLATKGDTRHYLNAIRVRLETLYAASTNNPRLREQLSDEVDWIDVQLASPQDVGREG